LYGRQMYMSTLQRTTRHLRCREYDGVLSPR
jgi:hypothetical protein